jgi:hypothetical protein
VARSLITSERYIPGMQDRRNHSPCPRIVYLRTVAGLHSLEKVCKRDLDAISSAASSDLLRQRCEIRVWIPERQARPSRRGPCCHLIMQLDNSSSIPGASRITDELPSGHMLPNRDLGRAVQMRSSSRVCPRTVHEHNIVPPVVARGIRRCSKFIGAIGERALHLKLSIV